MAIIIGLISIAIETCILALVANKLLVQRFHIGFIFAIFVGLQVIRRLYLFDGEVWSGASLHLVSYALSFAICYQRDIKKKISLFIVYSAITVSCEIVIVVAISQLTGVRPSFDAPIVLYAAYAIHKLLLAGLAFLFLRVYKTNVYAKEWFKYLPIPLSIFIAFLWFYDTSIENSDLHGHMMALGILGFLTCLFMLGFVQYKEMQRRTSERLEHEYQKADYKEDRSALLRRQALLAHDSHHHIEFVAKRLQACRNGNAPSSSTIEELCEYTSDLLKLNEFDMKITGNHDVDCILWPKQQRAEEKEIRFKVTGWLPERMEFLDSMDLVTIIGNGLANAIDACEKIETGERYINVVFRLDNQLDIRINNPIAETPVVKKPGWFKSTKKGPGHGLGMESIREAVKKYDGCVYPVIKDGVFSLRIMLQQVEPTVNTKDRGGSDGWK